MVKTEYYRTRSDGVVLNRTYSDENKMLIRNDGVMYSEAIDIEDAPYTYTESDEEIELTAEEALNIILGGGGA